MFPDHLEARFQRPENFQFGHFINSDGKSLRYGSILSSASIASCLFVGGTNQIIEEDFESFRDLAAMGLNVFVLERYGEAGSARHYPDAPQKQANVPFDIHVRDMHDFICFKMGDQNKPRILIGHCLGGMVSLLFLSKYNNIFDHAFLTAPFLRLILKTVTPEIEIEIATRQITAENERTYIGKGRDWDWDLAQKLLARDTTTHDPVRSRNHDLWLHLKPELRLGANTHASMIRKARALQELFTPGTLERIQTSTTLISPGEDHAEDSARRAFVANRIPNCNLQRIEGAGHEVWCESDEYRQPVFDFLKDAIVRTSAHTKRVKPQFKAVCE
jgi:lysophospholipase